LHDRFDRAKIPIAAELTESKQTNQETAMRVTCDALAVATPIWMIGNSAYDTLDCHDHLLPARVVPVAPYNPIPMTRNISSTGSKAASNNTARTFS
jgi:hypothetical protein